MASEITLGFLGDLYLGTGGQKISPSLLDTINNVDFLFGNLEGPILSPDSQASNGVKKDSLIFTQYEACSILKDLSLSTVGLANNHIFDFGESGLHSTIDALKGLGIGWVGAGVDHGAATQAKILDVQGVKIGILAFSEKSIETIVATKNSAGCADLIEEDIRTRVKELCACVDVPIISLHWGLTNYSYPQDSQINVARGLIDSGATIIVGHHPHVVQGLERYKRGLIIYSLGNFIFQPFTRQDNKPLLLSRENRHGTCLKISVQDKEIVGFDLIFSLQSEDSRALEVLSNKDYEKRRQYLNEISSNLHRINYQRYYRFYTLKRLLLRLIRVLNPFKWRNVNRGQIKSFMIALNRIFMNRNS